MSKKFTPISPPYAIYDKDGGEWTVIGWFENDLIVEPVVHSVEAGRSARWSFLHGEDGWWAGPPA